MSDVNGTVVAIQGNDVKAESLGANEDGYVLTWDNSDSNWEAAPLPVPATGLRKGIFYF